MEIKNKKSAFFACFSLFFACFCANSAEIKCNTARMQAMDKITGRVSIIEVPVGGEVKFGTFSIVVRDCQTRKPEETPENFAFVDVIDYPLKSEPVNIFKGWMLSSNPAINPVEHPIYDVWLLSCVNSEVDEQALLSAEALKNRDETAVRVIEESEPQKVEVETIVAAEEEPAQETSAPKTLSEVVNKVMIDDMTFAVSEDVGDDEPNLIIPEYQFKIGE